MTTKQPDHTARQKSRRHFLRGAGVALALPWMESLPLLAQAAGPLAQAADPNKPPLRFACIYFSNGVDPTHYWAKGSGASMEFGPAAEPLAHLATSRVSSRWSSPQPLTSSRRRVCIVW